MYIVDGRSDSEIAKHFGIDRTAVVHFRKYHDIPTRIYTGETGEGIVAFELQKNDFVVVNMNLRSKIHPFDLLVNGKVRIDVKSAIMYQGSWKFNFGQKPQSGIIESDHYIRLPNGRMKKLFSTVCDFLILCCIHDDNHFLFVLPTSVIPDTQQTIAIYSSGVGKWWEWKDRFDLIWGVIRNQSYSGNISRSCDSNVNSPSNFNGDLCLAKENGPKARQS
ncbi:MAG: hypothetical protein Q8911_00245 [Bacillota bacterium]|nr:hypothetical protein [Bacillota bacterium]